MTDGKEREAAPSQRRLYGEEWHEDVLEALRMAAKDAHLKAYQTGTGVVYRRNGKMGVYPPDPDMYEDLIPAPFEDSYEI